MHRPARRTAGPAGRPPTPSLPMAHPLPRPGGCLAVSLAALTCACSGGSDMVAPPGTLSHDSSLVFVDRLVETGTQAVTFGRAVAVSDLDQDGRLDIVAAHAGMPNSWFRQKPDGTFEDAAAAWGIEPDDKMHWGLITADLDNDGDEDVYVASGGFMAFDANQVLRNDIATTGMLTDVSAASGQGDWNGRNFSATALDHDNDGLLDIFLTDGGSATPNAFLHNEGNLSFVQIAPLLGITQGGAFLCSSSGDFDSDGWMDIATSDYYYGPVLYQNLGDGRFRDIADLVGLTSINDNFGLVLEDFNNDGWLDLFLPKYDKPGTNYSSRLYLNDQVSSFQDVTAQIGFPMTTTMGHTTGDLDADGTPDVLIGTGNPDFADVDYLFLVREDGTGGVSGEDASVASGFQAPGETRCHGHGLGDFDGDGDIDVYVNNGGISNDPATIEENAFLFNEGNDNRWAGFTLEGITSNRSAIGAHIWATTDTGREVHRYKRAGHGFGNTHSPIQHVGIGTDDFITTLRVKWPSGLIQEVTAPAMGEVTALVETGLILTLEPGSPGAPDACEVLAVGPAGHEIDLVLGRRGPERGVADHTVSGRDRLAAPGGRVDRARLGPDGKARFVVDLPEGWRELDLGLQAWIRPHGADGGGTLSNRIDLVD